MKKTIKTTKKTKKFIKDNGLATTKSSVAFANRAVKKDFNKIPCLTCGKLVTTDMQVVQCKKCNKKDNPVENYTASIKIFGMVYTSTGSTVRATIENLKVGNKVGGVTVLSVSKGSVTKEKVLNMGQMTALFSRSPLMREIALKNVTNLFDL